MQEDSVKIYPGITQSLGIAGIVILAMLVSFPVSYFLKDLLRKEVLFLVEYVVIMGTAFGIVWFLRKKFTGQTSFKLKTGSPRLIALSLLVAIATLVGVVIHLSYLTTQIIPMPDFFKEVLERLGDIRHWANVLAIVIAAPVLEELIFRGIMLDGLLKKYSPATAIFVSSFFFALIHLNPWQFVTAMIIGILIGWVYYHTRSLSLAILIHLANNLFVTLLEFIYPSQDVWEGELSVVEFFGGWVPLVFIAGTSLMVLAAGLVLMKREFVNLKSAGKL